MKSVQSETRACLYRWPYHGEASPVWSWTVALRVTMDPSCGYDQESKWFPPLTCPSRLSKDAGTTPFAQKYAAIRLRNHLKWLQKFRLNKLNKIFSSFSCSFHPHVVFCRSMNEIKNLHYLPRASEPREVLFEDRTKAHADHVGQSFDWQSTAAVGVLKAVHFGEWWLFFSFKNYVKHQCVTSSNGLFCVFMLIINVLQE